MSQHGVPCQGPHLFLPCDERSHGHSSAQSLAEQEDVRHDIVMLEAPKFPCSAEAGLDLVQDEERPCLIATLPECLHPRLLWRIDAPFRLDRLCNDAGRPVRDGFEARVVIMLY